MHRWPGIIDSAGPIFRSEIPDYAVRNFNPVTNGEGLFTDTDEILGNMCKMLKQFVDAKDRQSALQLAVFVRERASARARNRRMLIHPLYMTAREAIFLLEKVASPLEDHIYEFIFQTTQDLQLRRLRETRSERTWNTRCAVHTDRPRIDCLVMKSVGINFEWGTLNTRDWFCQREGVRFLMRKYSICTALDLPLLTRHFCEADFGPRTFIDDLTYGLTPHIVD